MPGELTQVVRTWGRLKSPGASQQCPPRPPRWLRWMSAVERVGMKPQVGLSLVATDGGSDGQVSSRGAW